MRPALQQFFACSSTFPVSHKVTRFQPSIILRCYSDIPATGEKDLPIENKPQPETQLSIRRHRAHISPKASARLVCSAKRRDSVHHATIEEPTPKKLAHTGGKERKWRARLSTFAQYAYESNLEGPPGGCRQRLLDVEAYSTDWGLWLELLRFQQRHYGKNGIIRLWKNMRERGLSLPTEGPHTGELWDRILQAALQDEKFMEEVLAYASHLQQEIGGMVPELYTTIMVSKLKLNTSECLKWHTHLKQQFPPRLEDYRELFEQALQARRLFNFEAIYKNHILGPMYGLIAPKLCKLGMFAEAYRWHFILLESKDPPSAFAAIEPLVTHFAQLNDDRRVELLTTSTIASGSQIEAPLSRFVRGSETISREIMNRQLGEVHGIVPKQLSDNFCARLFATKLFRVETVISGLEMMAVERLGPQSLREIVIRDDCSCGPICRHLDLLKEAGIRFGTSKYETLIRQAALGNRKSLLRSIVNCDAHPDTFEDIDLQERMFAMYLSKKNAIQMERILATITCEVQERDIEMQKKNFLLRGYIRLDNKSKVMSLLEEMRVTNIPLTPKTSRHLRVRWLSRRRVGGTGSTRLTLEHLSLIVPVMKQTLRSGGSVPIEAWKEILRRLGMTGNLNPFQSLAIWLASWYANPSRIGEPERSLQRSFDRIAISKQNERYSTTKMLPHNNLGTSDLLAMPKTMVDTGFCTSVHSSAPAASISRHSRTPHKYLNQLFTKAVQKAIIAWGFQQHVKKPPRSAKHDLWDPNSQLNWTWGLLLLRNLRDCGVAVERSLVRRACKERLAILFGTSAIHNPQVNRATRRRNDRRLADGEPAAQYGAYVLQMEAIWGKDLFVSHPKGLLKGRELHGPDESPDGWRIVKAEKAIETFGL